MNELSLFSGAGGGLLGTKLLGFHPIGYVEWDDYCQRVIAARIKDGYLPDAPIFGDIKTFVSDGYAASYTGMVDVITGGFPCQDISCAGQGKGIEGERSGLWKSMAEAIRIIRPRYVLVENSPMLTIRGLGTVLRDLAEMGMDAQWGCIPASYVGAPHGRDRVWILADAMQSGWTPVEQILPAEYPDMGKIFQPDGIPVGEEIQTFWGRSKAQREVFGDAPICTVDDGMAGWMDELAAIGNGQVPSVVASAWRILTP